MRPRLPRALVMIAALLALAVVGLGAYVRLSDAGLGCPDWPGCYGQVSPHHAAGAIAAAQAEQPEGPVSTAKAWKEMVHRYLASLLGLVILAIAGLAWRRERGLDRGLALGLAGLVVFQGLLGMWTVTLGLRPAIVSAHLVGGMTTLALLVWLAARLGRSPDVGPEWPVGLARLALLAVAMQIALGGWVSSHYAALACADFPTCGGAWWPDADWRSAFRIDGEAGLDALVAMHWAHRLGAVLVTLAVAALAWRLLREPGRGKPGWWLLGLLAGQLSLGALNILAGLPLAVAVAHNLVAALLLASLVWLHANSRRAT
ncbi:MAG: COX15/CtaA family protein [Gallionellaceae bacterium]|nr:COX15/CtaA family protein [Gallionellaceae bacterium]MDD5366837.1 COX15/CtaA family protein [Gallionellaceae bacterium]